MPHLVMSFKSYVFMTLLPIVLVIKSLNIKDKVYFGLEVLLIKCIEIGLFFILFLFFFHFFDFILDDFHVLFINSFFPWTFSLSELMIQCSFSSISTCKWILSIYFFAHCSIFSAIHFRLFFQILNISIWS